MKINLLQKNIPKGWEIKNFSDCVSVPSKISGLKKTDYKKSGKFPIFDQAKNYISGYTDNKEMVQTKVPAILFGDHTRILKIINKPFVLGADGTKMFYANEDIIPSFLYQQLLKLDIPNTGYNRHFKWLKDSKLIIPPIKEQKKIAEILSSVDEEIQKVEEMISVTEKLKQGLMQKVFSKKYPKKRIVDVAQVVSGATPKTSVSTYWNGSLVWITPKDLSILKSKYIYDSERAITETGFNNCSAVKIPVHSLIMSSRAPIGYLAINKTEVTTNQGCKSVIPSKDLNVEYLYYYLDFSMDSMRRLGSGSTFAEVGKTAVENFVIAVPEITEQKRIADIFSSVDEKNIVNHKLKIKLLELKKGLVSDLLSGKVRTI